MSTQIDPTHRSSFFDMAKSILVFSAGIMIFMNSCGKPKEFQQIVEISPYIELRGGVWADIEVPEPLRTPGLHRHGLCFAPILPARIGDDHFEIEDGAGGEIILKVVVVGPEGENRLEEGAEVIHPDYSEFCYEAFSTQVLNSPFHKVRLWASSSLEVENLRWRSLTQRF